MYKRRYVRRARSFSSIIRGSPATSKKFVTVYVGFLEGIVSSYAKGRETCRTKEGFHASQRDKARDGKWLLRHTTE